MKSTFRSGLRSLFAVVAGFLVIGRSSDPAWFDLGGGATLAFGALAAGYLIKTKQRTGPRPRPPSN